MRRQFRQTFVTFEPAQAFFRPTAPSGRVLLLSRPHPRVEHAKRFARGRDGVGRVQVHAALCFIAQWPQTTRPLAIEIKLGRILQAQHHCVLAHPRLRPVPMRFQDRASVHAVIVEEAVRRHRLTPAVAGLRHTHRRLRRQSLHQHPRSLVQARVAQIELSKFLLRLRCRSVCQLRHAKDESKRDLAEVYKSQANSLNVNGNFAGPELVGRVVYNEVS